VYNYSQFLKFKDETQLLLLLYKRQEIYLDNLIINE